MTAYFKYISIIYCAGQSHTDGEHFHRFMINHGDPPFLSYVITSFSFLLLPFSIPNEAVLKKNWHRHRHCRSCLVDEWTHGGCYSSFTHCLKYEKTFARNICVLSSNEPDSVILLKWDGKNKISKYKKIFVELIITIFTLFSIKGFKILSVLNCASYNKTDFWLRNLLKINYLIVPLSFFSDIHTQI